jgi:signal peptidase I
LAEGIGVAQPENKDYVKRVIGLPGDVVELHDGVLYLNGTAVDEPYLNPETDTSSYGPVTVPDGMLFVLGDNRLHSGDSRFPPPTGLGFVGEDKLIGKAFVIVYPPSRWGWL